MTFAVVVAVMIPATASVEAQAAKKVTANKKQKKAMRYYATNTATMSLQKGETVWIMVTTSSKPSSYTLKIKKK